MTKPTITYVTQKRLSWYGHVIRRDKNNVAKEINNIGNEREDTSMTGVNIAFGRKHTVFLVPSRFPAFHLKCPAFF